MRFYNQAHRFYCGIDLHARSMYLCILDEAGTIVLHKNLATSPEGASPPSFITTEGDASDVEPALGPSHRLTETVHGRDLAILNGRRRGTEDFLGRGERSSQLAEPSQRHCRQTP